jgi:acetylornithine deacetylase/succinyl-diaminopimelate desuccinylase-like protein
MLKTVELDEAGLRKEFRIAGWVHGMTGRELAKELIFGPTCTICGIRTGHTEAGAKTILPGAATARLDFRLVPDLTPALIVGLLREHLDKRGFQDIEVIELGSAPYAKSSPASMVARAAIENAGEVYEKPPVIYPIDPASGPVGAICGVQHPHTPVVSFGVSYYGSNPHGPDENIRLEDFLRGVKYFGRIIHSLAQLEEDAELARAREGVVQLNQ